MATRTRRDVWNLTKADPEKTLFWYAKAVEEMRKRAKNDPTSWSYQAAIHDVDGRPPLAQRDFWAQCQHFSWFFLPWHRWYLYYFEQIVASVIVSLKGPANWSLPYWNYSDSKNKKARCLPPAFTDEQFAGGDNPLLVEDRDNGNDGQPIGNDAYVDLTCLKESHFVGVSDGGPHGFGGPVTQFNHSDGSVGLLENVPHGSMHVGVGGFMSSFATAALDPIFWLHHANIDRLWQVWRARDPQNHDPVEANWPKMSFKFHDATKAVVTRTVRDVVDTTVLGYQYEDISDPFAGTRRLPLAAERVGLAAVTEKKRPVPEMIGASSGPVPLTNAPTKAQVAVTPARAKRKRGAGAPAFAAEAEDAAPSRIYLRLENVTGEGKPNVYEVYVNVPDGDDPRDHKDLFAGLMPMFGVAESSRQTEHHAGDGLHYSLDITDLANRLKERKAWDPAHLEVTFVPPPQRAPKRQALAASTSTSRFQVGRVSVYTA